MFAKQFISRMDSAVSPPGQPGFKIWPLRPENEIPSGRRQNWLSRHDCKQHLHNLNIKLSNETKIQCHIFMHFCKYMVKKPITGGRAA